MGIGREIDGLRRRLTKIQPLIDPPTLKMVMVRGEEPFPELDQWTLGIRIEDKNPAL